MVEEVEVGTKEYYIMLAEESFRRALENEPEE
jgi:hypothetical protein